MDIKVKQLRGCVLSALDGSIGHVRDIYFDDQTWAVRYVIADTGTWLSERLVLLSPNAFGRFEPENKSLEIKLSMKQIEESPLISTQKPISKQFEEEYFKYYGWTYYWQPDGALNMNNPAMDLSPRPVKDVQSTQASQNSENANLRSAQVVDGYRVQSADATIGHLSDFVIDTQVWGIQQIVVKPEAWFTATQSIEISVNKIERIDFHESTLYVNEDRP